MKTTPNLQPGALVLLREDNTTPLQWPKAVVANTHPGKDGIVRVVTIHTPRECLNDLLQNFAPYRVKVMTHSVFPGAGSMFTEGKFCVFVFFIHIN